MQKCKQHWMLNTPVQQLISAMTLPLLPAIFLLVSFDLLESFLVAQSGTVALAALAFSAPLTITIAAIAIATSITTNNWICKNISVDKSRLKGNIVAALLSTSVIVLLISLFFFICSPWILELLGINYAAIPASFHQGAKPDLAPLVNEYARLRILGWISLTIIWQVNGIFRSLGYVHRASILLSGWMLMKIIIAALLFYDLLPLPIQNNPLYEIALLHLIADALFALISIVTLIRRFNLTLENLTIIAWFKTLKQLSGIGLGAIFQQSLTPISIALLTLIVARLGGDKVAILGVVIRIEALALLIPIAFTASLPGLIAANWWAGEIKRVKALIFNAFIIIIITQLVIAIALFLNQYTISTLLSEDLNLQSGIEYYLTWVPVSFIGVGCVMVAMSCFNAMGCKSSAALLGFNYKIALVLPLALFASYLFGFNGLLLAIAAANGLMMFISWLFMANFINKHHPADFSSDPVLTSPSTSTLNMTLNPSSKPSIKPEISNYLIPTKPVMKPTTKPESSVHEI